MTEDIICAIINGIAEDFQKDFPEYTVKISIAAKNLVIRSRNTHRNKHTFLFNEIRHWMNNPNSNYPLFAWFNYATNGSLTQYMIYHHDDKPFKFDVAAPDSLEALYDWIKMKCGVK